MGTQPQQMESVSERTKNHSPKTQKLGCGGVFIQDSLNPRVCVTTRSLRRDDTQRLVFQSTYSVLWGTHKLRQELHTVSLLPPNNTQQRRHHSVQHSSMITDPVHIRSLSHQTLKVVPITYLQWLSFLGCCLWSAQFLWWRRLEAHTITTSNHFARIQLHLFGRLPDSMRFEDHVRSPHHTLRFPGQFTNPQHLDCRPLCFSASTHSPLPTIHHTDVVNQ